MRLIHFSDKVWHRRRGQKKSFLLCGTRVGHKAGVVPGIEANPMWVLKSKSTQPSKGIFQFSPKSRE